MSASVFSRPSDIKSVSLRFWSRVNRGDATECWLWVAGTSDTGYGEMRVHGNVMHAHRISWELAFGPITAGLYVLHSCDTPRCVNPAHLSLGTHTQNMIECGQRGRSPFGVDNHNAKLCDAKVTEMRARYALGESQASIARRFGVCLATAHSALLRHTWKRVP